MPETDTQPSLGIILISVGNLYRSANLKDVVEASGLPYLELDASTPEKMYATAIDSQVGQLMKLGRLLTKKELATYESHLRAQISDFASRYSWIAIFEDDAIINNESIDFLNAITGKYYDHPLHINLYPHRGQLPKNSKYSEKKGYELVEVDYLYSGAVAYVLSDMAIDEIRKAARSRAITPTDYPPIFNTFLKFVCISDNLFQHSESTPSLVYDSKQPIKNNKVFPFLGLTTLLSFYLFRKEHKTFLNYLQLEFTQRIKRRLF
jgi:GR25 family glycosyltransferase involved in LPS biosynthesis